MQDRVLIARTSLRIPHTRVRALSIRTIADGNATRDIITKTANVSAAPTNPVGRTNTARASATIRAATATTATTAQPIAKRASFVAAAVVPVLDRAGTARTGLRTPHTRVRAQSIRTTAAGDATQDTTTKMASVIAAPISRARPACSDLEPAITRAGTATRAPHVLRIAQKVSTAEAAVLQVPAHARTAQTSLRMRSTRARVPLT